MLTKIAFGLAITLAAVSGSLAAPHSVGSSQGVYSNNGPYLGSGQGVYSNNGPYVGTDPDRGIRFELNRDGDRARN